MNTLANVATKKFSIVRMMPTIVFIIMCCLMTGEIYARNPDTSGGVYYSDRWGYIKKDSKSTARKVTIKSEFKGRKYTKVGGFSGSDIESVVISKGIEEIDGSAFKDCKSLKKVTIPEGVTKIGSSAFKGCTSLKSITLPKSLRYISDSAFEDCTSLTVVNLPDGVHLGGDSFKGCTGVRKLRLPSDIENIPGGCFHEFGRGNGSDIVIPESVRHIGMFAFSKNKLIPKEIIIPKGVKIDDYAFSETSVISVIFSEGCETCNGFQSCYKLRHISLPQSLKVVDGFTLDISLAEIVLPPNVEKINEGAFLGCRNLRRIDIPDGVKFIGSDAFKDCEYLTSILIPSSVSKLQDIPFNYTFDNDPFFEMTPDDKDLFEPINYTRIYDVGQKYDFSADDFYFAINDDGETVTIVGDYFRCYNRESIEIPASVHYEGKEYMVTRIDDGAFASCFNIKEVTLPEGLTSIGNMAFVNCNSLREITLPESVSYVGRCAFKNCANLVNVHLPNQLTTINRSTFAKSGVQNINLGNIEVVEQNAFYYCEKLEDPDLSSLIYIGKLAFDGCKNIKILALPQIRAMEKSAFASCESLQHIFLSDSLTVIPDNAFEWCKNLISANLDNVLSFGDRAFSGCWEFYDYTLNPQAKYEKNSFKDCGVEYKKRIAAAQKAEEEQQRAAAEAQRKYEKSQRLEAWLGFATAVLNAAGQSFSDIAQAQRGTVNRQPEPAYTQTYSSTSGTTASTSSARSAVKTKRSSTAMDMQYRNSDQKVYDSYSSKVCSAYYGTGFYKNTPLSKIKDWQSTMRSIRLKWVNKGLSFYQSSWETKDFSNRK
jgi:hypothetical protein